MAVYSLLMALSLMALFADGTLCQLHNTVAVALHPAGRAVQTWCRPGRCHDWEQQCQCTWCRRGAALADALTGIGSAS
eukprot:1149007-Pelagomonas_calceolata.AAC.1